MRMIICLAVVALAGLATASYGITGSSLNFRGLVNGFRRSQGSSIVGYGDGYGPQGLFFSFLDQYLRGKEFTWHEAQYQCQIRGLQLVSLDNYHKDAYVAQLIYFYGVRWIWTSGLRHGYNFYWGNGSPIGYNYDNWSYTGSKGYPQPDNAEGNEYCVAVLNNYYQDGIRWHDIGCSHRKSFVCERPNYAH